MRLRNTYGRAVVTPHACARALRRRISLRCRAVGAAFASSASRCSLFVPPKSPARLLACYSRWAGQFCVLARRAQRGAVLHHAERVNAGCWLVRHCKHLARPAPRAPRAQRALSPAHPEPSAPFALSLTRSPCRWGARLRATRGAGAPWGPPRCWAARR